MKCRCFLKITKPRSQNSQRCFKNAVEIVKWVNSHDDILQLFRSVTADKFKDDARAQQKSGIGLYNPGDTRMATLYLMMHRLIELKEVLEQVVHAPAQVVNDEVRRMSYDDMSQKNMLAYNRQCKDDEKKYKTMSNNSTKLKDRVKELIKSDEFWSLATEFLQLAQTPFWLLRLVDSNLPTLSKVYYSCCCVDKLLRVEKAKGSELAAKMHKIFLSRWDRWHRPVHTAAYAFDPAYVSHKLSDDEVEEVQSVLKRLYPAKWYTIFSQWKDFKHQQGAFTTDTLPGLETIWSGVDTKPAWKFWDGIPIGDDMVDARKAGIQLTARASAASCCEFNWSDLDDIIGKRRTQLNTETIEKLARNRAVHRLKKSVATIDCNKKLPTLELMIDLELQKAQSSAVDFLEAEDDIIGSDLDESDDAELDLEADEEVETEDEYDEAEGDINVATHHHGYSTRFSERS